MFVHKENSLGIISFLIRKCIELELIEKTSVTEKINSIIHVHECTHYENGAISFRSDKDRSNEKKAVIIDTDYINNLESQVRRWIKNPIEIER